MKRYLFFPSLGYTSDDWSPSEIGATLWFDAADWTTIIESSGLVTEWINKGTAGSSYNGIAGFTEEPSYGTYTLNGINLLRFSFRKGFTTGYNLTSPYSIVLVSRNYNGGRVIQSSVNNALMCPYGRNNAFYVEGDVRYADLTTIGQWSIITMQILGSSPSQLWYNSINYANGSTHGDWGGFNIGGVGAFGQNPEADIAEIIVFNRSITTLDREKIEGYIAWKWALTSDLPSDHPYKTEPPTL